MDESPQQADWRRWLEEHAPKFLLYARQQARSEADAQDLVQEAVVEISQRQNDGHPPPPALVLEASGPRAWSRQTNRARLCWFAIPNRTSPPMTRTASLYSTARLARLSSARRSRLNCGRRWSRYWTKLPRELRRSRRKTLSRLRGPLPSKGARPYPRLQTTPALCRVPCQQAAQIRGIRFRQFRQFLLDSGRRTGNAALWFAVIVVLKIGLLSSGGPAFSLVS
jgi:hypothetical protein